MRVTWLPPFITQSLIFWTLRQLYMNDSTFYGLEMLKFRFGASFWGKQFHEPYLVAFEDEGFVFELQAFEQIDLARDRHWNEDSRLEELMYLQRLMK